MARSAYFPWGNSMADSSLDPSLPGGGNQGNAAGSHSYGSTAAEAPLSASVTAFAATKIIKVPAVLGLITTGLAARFHHPCLQRAAGVRIPDPGHRQSAFHHFVMACANAATGEIRGE